MYRLASFAFILVLAALASTLSACASKSTPGTGTPDTGLPMFDGGPLSRETCDDGIDTDRDGVVDEDCRCEPGESQRCFRGLPERAGVGACVYGTQRCNSDFELDSNWEPCEGDGFPGTEECNGLDDNCDGEIDEGCSCVDGERRDCYEGPAGTEGVGICRNGIQDCIGGGEVALWSECVEDVLPREERCDNGEDDDCDGAIDEGCTCELGATLPCFGGPSGSRGVGICREGRQTCISNGSVTEWGRCSGEVLPRGESCTGGGDEDCDGLTDCSDPDCASFCCEGYAESVPVVPAEGEVLFIIDRSGSMDWPAYMTTRTRWQELQDAVNGTLPLVSSLPLGMLTFPEMTGGDERLNCDVSSTVDIPIGLGNGGAIMSRLVTVDPRAGDTPTPQAFATAASYFAGLSSSRERFIILATDGLPEPNCGSTVDATVSAIRNIRSSYDVDTFVIGIVGPDRSGDTSGIAALRAGLNQMADAGGRARTTSTNRYYEAVDAASLDRALRSVIADATDCRFTLSSTPPRPTEVEVRQDGSIVPASGYRLSGRDLELTGTYCTRIRAGLVRNISVTNGCGS